jgi:hypothetical protein
LLDEDTFFLRAAVRRSVPDFLPADFFLRVVFFLLAIRPSLSSGSGLAPGIGNAPGSRPSYENAPVNDIDVESWQPAAGDCPSR